MVAQIEAKDRQRQPHLRVVEEPFVAVENIVQLPGPNFVQTDFFEFVGEPLLALPSELPEIETPQAKKRPIPMQVDLFKMMRRVPKEKKDIRKDGTEVVFTTGVPVTPEGDVLTDGQNEFSSNIFIGTEGGSTANLIYDGEGKPIYGVIVFSDVDRLRRHNESHQPLQRGRNGFPSFRRIIEVEEFSYNDEGQAVAVATVPRVKGRRGRVITLTAPGSAVDFARELRGVGTVQQATDSEEIPMHKVAQPERAKTKKGKLSDKYPVTLDIRPR